MLLLTSAIIAIIGSVSAQLAYEPLGPLTIFEDESLEVIVGSGDNGDIGDIWCRLTYDNLATLTVLEINTTQILIKLSGKRLGREYVECAGLNISSNDPVKTEIPLVIVRRHNIIDSIFVFLIIGVSILLNIVFGTDVNLTILKFIVRRPKPLLAAGVCQFVLLPPVGLAIARAFAYEPDVALGMLMVACAPGGGNSNTATFLVDGEVPLSITMTFFSTALALGMMPWNIWVYGRFVSEDPKYTPENIPYLKLVSTLACIVGPVAIGMLLASRAGPKLTRRLMRYCKPLVFSLLAVVICIAMYKSRYAFGLMTVDMILGSALLPVSGMTLGILGSLVARLRLSQLKTIAFEIGFQNAGIVIGMGQVAFEQPEADLNLVMPFCVIIMTSVIALPLYASHYLLLRALPPYKRTCVENRAALDREKHAYFSAASPPDDQIGTALAVHQKLKLQVSDELEN